MTSEERFDPADQQLSETNQPEDPPRRFKREDEMSQGKNHRLEEPDAQFEFDPSKHQSYEEGGEPH